MKPLKQLFRYCTAINNFTVTILQQINALQFFQIVRYAAFVLLGVVLAKGGFTLTQIGAYENLIFTSGLVTFFWVGAVINTMLSMYGKTNEEQRQKLLYNTFLTLLGASILISCLLWFFALLPFQLISERSITQAGNRTVLMLAGAYILFNVPAFVNEYILYVQGRHKTLVVYAVLTALATLLLSFLLLYFTNYEPLFSIAFALCVVAFGKFLFSINLLHKHAVYRADKILLLQHLGLVLPLLLALFISGSSEYVDGWIVGEYFPKDSFAIYRYGAKELPVLLIVANTFSAAMLPVVSANLQNGLEAVKYGSAKLMHWMFPLTIVLLMVSKYAYRYAFSEEFEDAHQVFDIYLLLVVPRLIFPQSILTAIGKTKYILMSSVLEISLNISLSLLFAKWWGLKGIALGTLVAFCADKLFLTAICYFKEGITPAKYIPVKVLALYCIVVLSCYILSTFVFGG